MTSAKTPSSASGAPEPLPFTGLTRLLAALPLLMKKRQTCPPISPTKNWSALPLRSMSITRMGAGMLYCILFRRKVWPVAAPLADQINAPVVALTM
ncbi:hypothetical protein D9M70_643720 [compost metagenome]